MTGASHTTEKGKEFGMRVMQHMNVLVISGRLIQISDFSVYGTPMESTTYKFAKCLQERFGIIEGVTDRAYITNSYHVHVAEDINAFELS